MQIVYFTPPFDPPPEMKGHFSLDMPKGAEILTVGVQHSQARIFALVDKKAPKEKRNFCIIRSWCEIDEDLEEMNYIGTYQSGDNFGHIFEIG